MTKFFLILHILAAIVAIGPVAVAASMFPPVARKALAAGPDGLEETATLGVLNRICKVYAGVALAVPVFGFAVAGVMKVTGQPWVIVSIVLTALAAVLLAVLVLPRQAELLAGKGPQGREVGVKDTKQLAMYTGIFNLLWAAVTIIMIVRPGSTLGH